MLKNTFYFMLKALFVLEIFTYLSWLFGYVEKGLDKKAIVNFKIYDVTDWTTNNYNTLIAQYLKKQSNQTVKFGQLIECNIYNIYIFLEKSYTNCGGEASPRIFYKISKLNYLWINSLKCYTVCLSCISRSWSTKKLKPRCWPLADHLPHFLHDFWRNFINAQISLPNYFLRYLVICEM